jgi:biopolymer transport protein ExbD
MLSKLGPALEKISTRKNQTLSIASATITPKSSVNYENLVSVLDALRQKSIVNIGVLTARGQ